MSLYKVMKDENEISDVPETDFSFHGIFERYNIQEWIEKRTEILGEPLLIIAKEFNAFDRTNERADLVALDSEGNIVVIELKRDDSGSEVHWQAIKYASYFRKVSGEDVVNIYSKFRSKDYETSYSEIVDFLNHQDLGSINRSQRVILCSHRFAVEVTSAVLWLVDNGINIKCVQIIPYEIDGMLLIQSSIIIPVPGSEPYEVTASIGNKELIINRVENKNKNDTITASFRKIAEHSINSTNLDYEPNIKTSRWAGVHYDLRYYKIWFEQAPWDNHRFSFQLHTHHVNNLEDKFVSVEFAFNKSWLAEQQWADDNVILLVNEVSKLSPDFGNIESSEDYFQIIRYFNKSSLDKTDDISNHLTQLIDSVVSIVKQLT